MKRRMAFLTKSSKSPASIAKSNKQGVGTCFRVVFLQGQENNHQIQSTNLV